MIAIEGVRAEFLLSACQRYDLSPIPLTLEAQIRLTPETAQIIKDGELIRVNEVVYRIIKCQPMRNSGASMQGDAPLSAVSITAFPDGVVNVARRRRSAVIFDDTTFANIYRSCGATVGVHGEMDIARFACFKGDVPTFQLAKVLQEESAVLMWRAGKVSVKRLRDLMTQEPINSAAITASEDIQSDFLEADEVPIYFSTGADGAFLSGERRSEVQAVTYAPHKSARQLAQLGRVLVRRKVVTGLPSPEIRAGDVMDIRGARLIVMTAAHYMQNNTDGNGAAQYSRFWLGDIS